MTISSYSRELDYSDIKRILKSKQSATMGFANESRLLGALLARDYNASRVALPYSTYGIIVEIDQKDASDIIRVQVKTVSKSKCITFIGGTRGEVKRACKSSEKKYVPITKTSDVVVGVEVSSDNGEARIDFYFIPTIYIELINQKSSSVNLLKVTQNNWKLFENCKNREYVVQLFGL